MLTFLMGVLAHSPSTLVSAGIPPKERNDLAGSRDRARAKMGWICLPMVLTSGLYWITRASESRRNSLGAPMKESVRPGRPRPRMPLVMPSPRHMPCVAKPICCLATVMLETVMLL